MEDPSANDWFRRNGIPHEVSKDVPEQYLPFKRFAFEIARGWERFIEQPQLRLLSDDAFGGVYERGGLFTFFQVLRARIKKNVTYAYWTNIAVRCFTEALNMESDKSDYPSVNFANRMQKICFSLFYYEYYSGQAASVVREFIATADVKACFMEYAHAYLHQNLASRNSCWNTIQARLGDLTVDETKAVYGLINTDPNAFDKSKWSHEDHACRFIVCVYEALRNWCERRDVSNDTAWLFERYNFSNNYNFDMTDKYWFGWSLLTFLMLCFQHSMVHDSTRYEDVLAPVLYEDWQMGNVVNFPPYKIAMMNVSPYSKWNTDDFENQVDISMAVYQGILTEEDERLLENPEYESETEVR
ncbi:hypothetical protein GGR52DRAFT_589896 [Hypoxylon sp. FL1284]|nr:hypothetical protein GGR52DRAFT_589896 [Hypoxylon sp. FL1284]